MVREIRSETQDMSLRRCLDNVRTGFSELLVDIPDGFRAGLKEITSPKSGRDVCAERLQRCALYGINMVTLHTPLDE